jgi:hypothetical protein
VKLVNCGAGELSDRLTILALKILAGTDAGKDISHFETERLALLSQIRARTLNGKWFAGLLELGAVNAMLWHAEDALRDLRVRFGGKELGPDINTAGTVRLAFRIQGLNDRRAELIAEINKDAGDSEAREKL